MDIRSMAYNTASTSESMVQSAARSAPPRSSAIAVDTSTAVAQTSKAPDAAQVKEAVKNINDSLQTLAQGVVFSIDEKSNSTIVKVIDQETQEVLRQIPSKEALEIARALGSVSGMLIKQKA